MRVYFFSLISILNSFIISREGVIYFIDYFIKYGDISNNADNTASIGLAGVLVGLLFLIVHIIFHIFILVKASKKRVTKIYLSDLFISKKNTVFSNILNVITYLIIVFLITVLYRKQCSINTIEFKFYSLCIICVVIYSIWINNVFLNNKY